MIKKLNILKNGTVEKCCKMLNNSRNVSEVAKCWKSRKNLQVIKKGGRMLKYDGKCGK